MVPFTIFHRLSSLGSGGGVNAGTFPPENGHPGKANRPVCFALCLSSFYCAAAQFLRDPGHRASMKSHSAARILPFRNGKSTGCGANHAVPRIERISCDSYHIVRPCLPFTIQPERLLFAAGLFRGSGRDNFPFSETSGGSSPD